MTLFFNKFVKWAVSWYHESALYISAEADYQFPHLKHKIKDMDRLLTGTYSLLHQIDKDALSLRCCSLIV